MQIFQSVLSELHNSPMCNDCSLLRTDFVIGCPDNESLLERYAGLFGKLPLAAQIAQRTLVVHGGLWRNPHKRVKPTAASKKKKKRRAATSEAGKIKRRKSAAVKKPAEPAAAVDAASDGGAVSADMAFANGKAAGDAAPAANAANGHDTAGERTPADPTDGGVPAIGHCVPVEAVSTCTPVGAAGSRTSADAVPAADIDGAEDITAADDGGAASDGLAAGSDNPGDPDYDPEAEGGVERCAALGSCAWRFASSPDCARCSLVPS
jgi:hypothetical protein